MAQGTRQAGTERVTDVLDKVRFSNRLPDGTRNGEDREDEP
ncbi:hypothetical protein NXX52_14935 [Bacteroides ovatus]|nr:hypothetical protein [Bacteroides ovatus]